MKSSHCITICIQYETTEKIESESILAVTSSQVRGKRKTHGKESETKSEDRRWTRRSAKKLGFPPNIWTLFVFTRRSIASQKLYPIDLFYYFCHFTIFQFHFWTFSSIVIFYFICKKFSLSFLVPITIRVKYFARGKFWYIQWEWNWIAWNCAFVCNLNWMDGVVSFILWITLWKHQNIPKCAETSWQFGFSTNRTVFRGKIILLKYSDMNEIFHFSHYCRNKKNLRSISMKPEWSYAIQSHLLYQLNQLIVRWCAKIQKYLLFTVCSHCMLQECQKGNLTE